MMDGRRLEHTKQKNPKDGEARDQGWRTTKRVAIGTSIVAALLIGRCMSEPPMKEPAEPVKIVECEVEKGEHKDLCKNGKEDKGVFVAFVRVEEGKDGKSTVYKLAKVKIDECDKKNQFFCEEDCKTKKEEKKKHKRRKRKRRSGSGKLPSVCSDNSLNPSDTRTLKLRITNKVKGAAGALSEALDCHPPKSMKVTVRAKVSKGGDASLHSASAVCGGEAVGDSGTILQNIPVDTSDLSMGLFRNPCVIVTTVKIR